LGAGPTYRDGSGGVSKLDSRPRVQPFGQGGCETGIECVRGGRRIRRRRKIALDKARPGAAYFRHRKYWSSDAIEEDSV